MPLPVKKKNLKRTSVKEYVYNSLKDWIVSGTLKPDEPVNDKDIADYFNVSRTPVREAMLLLSQERFIDVVPSKGTKVASMSASEAASIYEALGGLAGSVVQLVCAKRTDKDLEILTALNQDFAAAVDKKDFQHLSSLDKKFHQYLLKIADNPYLTDYTNQLTAHADRYEAYYFSGERQDYSISVNEHARLIEAIHNRDVIPAVRYAQKNWLGFYETRLKEMLK